jgi:peptidoglycan-associated lipoprotein
MKKIGLLFVLIGLMTACNSPLQQFKNGQKRFENGEYQLAIAPLQAAVSANFNTAQAQWLLGESYRLSNRYGQAQEAYQKALEAGSTEENLRYHLAFGLKNMGQYEAAKAQLTQFLAAKPKTREYVAKAQRELENLTEVVSLAQRNTPYTVKALDINTPGSEFAPMPFNEGKDLVFTASKKSQTYRNNGLPFLGIYVTDLANPSQTGKVQLFSGSINLENANEGSVAFSRDGRTMVFARGNTGRRKDLSPDVDLYLTRQYEDKWSEPELVSVSDSASWDGSPAFSGDGKTLYFASNRRGGYGGIDLYSARMDKSGRFGRAQNMGAVVNTPGDEMFPYVARDGKLYFASDGHAGLGKLDIFVAIRKSGEINIQNMGLPINSPGDDFGLVPIDSLSGYFASNRGGGKGDDDIYFYENNQPVTPTELPNQPNGNPPVTSTDDPNKTKRKLIRYFVAGVVKDNQGQTLDSVYVRFMDEAESLLAEGTTPPEGKFGKFSVEENLSYLFKVEKPGYLTKRQSFSMVGMGIPQSQLTKAETDTTFFVEILMEKPQINRPIDPGVFAIAPIYYDLDKSDIRIDASEELDKIVQIMNDNPTLRIELGSHTDSRASGTYNIRLSQRRADAAVTYIISKGIAPNRIRAKGYGETQLVNGCSDGVECSEADHQQNRRTEFKVLSI